MKEIRFSVPLKVRASGKKNFIMNLNNYRNAHYFTLNNAKKHFHELIDIPVFAASIIKIDYGIYPASKRLFDINNVCSIIDKFICDTLVERGYIPDDNIQHVPFLPSGRVVEIDKENPRCEVQITIIRH